MRFARVSSGDGLARSLTKFSNPFPYAVIENFISPEVVSKINQEWPDGWNKEQGKNNKKWHTTKLPPTAQEVADSVDLQELQQITGIHGLFADPELFGAGLHCIPSGGFLNIHVDFNRHPKGWHRRVNLLIYLNERWEDEWNGHLVLGANSEKKIAPLGGRAVIFETTEESWHGHPAPLRCPPEVQRRSLALYYYTHTKPKAKAHTTIYR